MNFEFHPVANIFPMMNAQEYMDLKTDIADNGQREAIYVYEGKILDGRNRYRACVDLGIEPIVREWDGKGDLVKFVVSLNLHRRHLNESQRGMVAAKLANIQRGGDRKNQTANLQFDTPTRAAAADMLNVSERTVNTARKVYEQAIPEVTLAVESGKLAVSTAAIISEAEPAEQVRVIRLDDHRAIVEAAKQIQAAKREERREERVQKIVEISKNNKPLNGLGRYNVIYADPPWRYDHSVSTSRDIENQYPTMNLDEICALPIGDISAEDCVLFLWVTSPKLEDSLRVINSWGFAYRTCAVWVKDKIGMGYYFRQQHELLLVATKGSLPTPEPSNRCSSVIDGDRVEHSKKPESVYGIIEEMYPEFTKVELFSRQSREGWDAWGNQV